MGEGLWEITKCFAACADFFRIQPDVVGVAQHTFKEQPCVSQLRAIDASQ